MPEESEHPPSDDDDGGPSWGPPTGAPQEPPGAVPDDEPGSSRSVPFPDAPKPRRRRRVAMMGVAVVVVLGLVATVLVIVLGGDDDTTTVATADGEIAAPDAVLDDAATEFMLAVRSTGARSGSRAGCFWRLGDGDGEEALADAIVCGPARFAAGGDWLQVPIESEPGGEEGVTVEFSLEGSRFVSDDEAGASSDGVELIGIDGAEPQLVELDEPERGGHAFLPDGRRLEEADELVNAGVFVVASQTGEVAPRLHEDAGCWLPSEELDVAEPAASGDGDADGDEDDAGGGDADGGSDGGADGGDDTAALLCGPVLELRDDPSMPWKLLRVGIEPAGGPWAVTADPDSLEVVGSLPFAEDVDLYHPEGLVPPDAEGFRPPDPLPVDDDYAAAAFESDLDGHEYLGDVEFKGVRAGTIRTPDFTAMLDGRATTRRLGEGPDALIAPEDHQFVVFKYSARPIEPVGQVQHDATRLRLVAGKTRRDVATNELPAVGGRPRRPLGPRMQIANTRGRTLVVVAVMPRDTPDAELVVGNRGRAQRVSMRNGRGTALVDGIGRHGDVAAIDVSFDITVTSPGAANTPQAPEEDGFLRGRIARARVRAWNENRQWAPEGSVFVSVEIPEITDGLGGPGWTAAYAWGQMVSLRTPDDQVLQPLGVPRAPQPLDDRPAPLRFAVPADVDNLALIIDPRGEAQFPEDDLQFTIEPDQPFETSFSLR